jgi:hypothetical protein
VFATQDPSLARVDDEEAAIGQMSDAQGEGRHPRDDLGTAV